MAQMTKGHESQNNRQLCFRAELENAWLPKNLGFTWSNFVHR